MQRNMMISIKEKISWRFITDLLMAFLTYIAIYSNGKIPTEAEVSKIIGGAQGLLARGLAKFTLSLPVATLESGFVFCVLFFLYYRFHHILRPIKKAPFILAAFFSICMILGKSYDIYNGSAFIWQNHFQLFWTVINFLGWVGLFYIGLQSLMDRLDDFRSSPLNTELAHSGWIYSWRLPSLLFLCWLPLIIVHLPSSFDWDAFVQLQQWSGQVPLTTHHPVIATCYFGIIMDLGKMMGNVNAGAFILALIQTICMLISITLLIQMMDKLKFSSYGIYLATAFFAICPIWGGYAQAVIKDSMNLVFLVLYVLILFHLLIDDKWISTGKNKVLLLISLISLSWFRNTGIHLAILTFGPYIFYHLVYTNHGRTAKQCVVLFTLYLLIHIGVNSFLLPGLGVKSGSPGEMLSIPFQQTARYVKYYPNDITEKEKKVISKYLKYDELAQKYNPNISDPIKGGNRLRTSKDLKDYIKVWAAMGIRHPGVYVDSFINGTYEYFYPNGFGKVRRTGIKLYISTKDDGKGILRRPHNDVYDVKYIIGEKTRKKAYFYVDNLIRSFPILGLCYNTGIYTWILLICCMILVQYKKYYEILGLLPSFVILLISMASPVNGNVRYMLPAIAVTPLIIAWTLYSIRNKNEDKGEISR